MLLGTAGHVDHGKTSLVRALTGTDTDRLPEEKARGLTIDLGFACLDLSRAGRVSIVDVPGHERFIHNMLVGAQGFEAAMLCVAADEGVKPQTREHLEVLELLPVQRLVVALTKADRVDEEGLELARLDVLDLLEPTRFADAVIVPTSAETGQGLDELRRVLDDVLTANAAPAEGTRWFLPIDRVFTVKGHGTIVTGTLAGGTVRSGEPAVLLPGDTSVRVRNVQSHDETVASAGVGSRVALNLGGVELEHAHRGMVVCAPGAAVETTMLDANVEWKRPPKHAWRVRVSIGTDEVIGKVFLSESDPTVAQFRFERATVATKGQPLIVRRYSPPVLLGGGRVEVPLARPRRKSDAIAKVAEASLPDQVVDCVARSLCGVETDELCRLVGRSRQEMGEVFEVLRREERLLGFAGLWLTPELYEACKVRLLETLKTLHAQAPNKATVPRERAVAGAELSWNGKPLDRLIARMAETGDLVADGTLIKRSDHRLALSERQAQLLARVVEVLESFPVDVPPTLELSRLVGIPPQAADEILRLGWEAGMVVRIEDLWYTPKQLEGIRERVRALGSKGPFTAAEFRDAVGTSRKYAIPLLEHLDAVGFTRRMGDRRVLER